MRALIPAPVIAIVAEVIASAETHTTLDSLFMYAGAPGDPPEGSKQAKALAWLRKVNTDATVQPLAVLGKLIEGYMEVVIDPDSEWDRYKEERRDRIQRALTASELQYVRGGRVIGALGAPSQSLEQAIRERNIVAMNQEFERALRNVEAAPREAVSAASNLLESLCKVYIHDEQIEMPPKQDLRSLWPIVRKNLGLDPAQIEDRDLQEILTGIGAIVSGIGALRTHASSAHGAGKRMYKLEPRHSRLAIHAAHTLALFILETWDNRKAV